MNAKPWIHKQYSPYAGETKKSSVTMKFRAFSGHMASEIATSSTLWLCQNRYCIDGPVEIVSLTHE